MNAPLVSILIPVYNAGSYLRASLESILNQTYENLEILVIDDGSTDGCMASVADVRDARVRVLHQENAGKSVALNRAMEEMHGELYAIHDADDLSHPERIERQVACMLEHPEVAAVFTGYDLIIGDRHLAPRIVAKDVEQCRLDIEQMRMPSHDPTAMFRVLSVKGIRYEPGLRVGQGWDYILRVGEQHPMMVIGRCLYSYRTHDTSHTRSDAVRRESKVRDVLSRACERRGLGPFREDMFGKRRRIPLGHRSVEHGVVPHFIESVVDLRRAKGRLRSLATALACARLHPLDPYYYKPLLFSAIPLASIDRYRRIRARISERRSRRIAAEAGASRESVPETVSRSRRNIT